MCFGTVLQRSVPLPRTDARTGHVRDGFYFTEFPLTLVQSDTPGVNTGSADEQSSLRVLFQCLFLIFKWFLTCPLSHPPSPARGSHPAPASLPTLPARTHSCSGRILQPVGLLFPSAPTGSSSGSPADLPSHLAEPAAHRATPSSCPHSPKPPHPIIPNTAARLSL